MQESIVVRGAREHNLRNISLALPQGRLIVFTGVSGSGKSSLAFDTLYAEGQRRYIASLSNYARQFLDQLPRPDVDAVQGLPPALCIDQRSTGRNPRSTVGTLTEVYDFLRVLWARVGQLHCPRCDRPVGAQGREAIVRQAAALARAGAVLVLAPLVQDQRGHHRDLLADLRRRGYLRVRVDGRLARTDERLNLDPHRRHTIEAVVDRLEGGELESRVWEAVDGALGLARGQLVLAPVEGPEVRCSTTYTCPACGAACAEPTPAALSFNTPQGWCPGCHGLGRRVEIVEEWLVPDPSLSIADGALAHGANPASPRWAPLFAALAERLGFDLHTPWARLTEAQRHGVLHGVPEPLTVRFGQRRVRLTYEGVLAWLLRARADPEGDAPDDGHRTLRRIGREVPCPECGGARLRPESLAVRLGGRNIAQAAALTVSELRRFLRGLELPAEARAIAGEALQEVDERLRFLEDVGVEYLTVDRPGPTLAGGEAQRIRLAAQLGRGLAGVLYVLDEPSIGLHQRDNRRLIETLRRLRDRGSTVVVVEHDEETIRSADHVVDFGPGAGRDGGRVVAQGTVEDLQAVPESVTGAYLSGRLSIPVPPRRRAGGPGLRVVGAFHHNLKDITVEFPSGTLIVVTGVSGSGKSSLVGDVVLDNLARLYEGREGSAAAPAAARGRPSGRAAGAGRPPRGARRIAWTGCRELEGYERFDKVIAIDQSPIGRIPRSNPATYTKVWDHVRALYAQLPEARLRGYPPGRFSFNVEGGRCPACEGNGARRLDMEFLADVWVTCEACGGSRFQEETLQVRFRGCSIADLLRMTVAEALEHFADVPQVRRGLQTLADVGLGYLELGQPSPTLSGGEAQRIKLARELSRRGTGRTLYVLDEPTTGLHFLDVARLLAVLQRLVDAGNTVVVVEHNLDVVKVADRVIDLGPEGGEAGGRVVAVGTPEEVARTPGSLTGLYLREVLEHGHVRGAPRAPAPPAARGGAEGAVGLAAAGAPAPALPAAAARSGGAAPAADGAAGLPSRRGSPEAVALPHARDGRAAGSAPRAAAAREEPGAGAGTPGSGKAGPQAAPEGPSAAAAARADGGPAGERGGREAPEVDPAGAEALLVVGAREHNLRDLTVRLPKERLLAFAGPSGAGKTSLALDTIYAEGQRRYVESLSAYARQFLGRAARPAVERIDGLCPAIAVQQRAVPANSRSTVGTLTETYDYLRLLYARAGDPRCPGCGGPVRPLAAARIAELAAGAAAAAAAGVGGGRLRVLAPADGVTPAGFAEWCARQRRAGYARAWVDGRLWSLENAPAEAAAPPLAAAAAAGDEPVLALVVDRVGGSDRSRLAEAVEAASAAAEGRWRGTVGVQPDADGAPARWWRLGLACEQCGTPQPPLSAHTFAFNDPRGWCPACAGTGSERRVEWQTLVPDGRLGLRQGGLGVWGAPAEGAAAALVAALAARHGFDLDTPLGALPPEAVRALLEGDPEPFTVDLGGGTPVRATYVGLAAGLEFARSQTHWGQVSSSIAALLTDTDCAACGGSRLCPQARAVRLGGRTLPEVLRLSLAECRAFFDGLRVDGREGAAVDELLREIRSRLHFLCEVGLEYLTLGRSSAALSGGEGQRIRLASQLGSGLTGVLYVLDEPTVGLHPRDTERLLRSLRGLQGLGNTVLTVEHDHRLLAAVDHVVEFGPGSGSEGGRVVAEGPPARLAAGPTPVGRYLRGERPQAARPRRAPRGWLVVRGARLHNLRDVDAAFPLGTLVAVTGVSGSGKTSLVIETLYADLARRLHRAQTAPGPHGGIEGLELVDKVIRVDQEPIGDSPRASPATYTGLFDTLRTLFARVPEARLRGYTSNHFSYNHPEGRCDRCEGHGYRRISMHFLPDVWVLCDACGGRRYRPPVLEVHYRGLNIADCLELTVDEAWERFQVLRSVRLTLDVLRRVGLGYLRLGQPAPTLSAGEAQRVKLARELARPDTGNTLYVLDEPTTGLAPGEVARLVALLDSLVDRGNTVICIEHDLDVVCAADWVIDMGPEGGAAGGRIVAAGPPEVVAGAPESRTAPYLRAALAGTRPAPAAPVAAG